MEEEQEESAINTYLRTMTAPEGVPPQCKP